MKPFAAILALIGVCWMIAAVWWDGYAWASVITGGLLLLTSGGFVAAQQKPTDPTKPPEYHFTDKEQLND